MDYRAFQKMLAAAKEIFGQLKKKHPELNGYLVLSSRFGQCDELTDDPGKLLSEFPACIVPSPEKEALAKALKNIAELDKAKKACAGKEAEKIGQQLAEQKTRVAQLTGALKFADGVQVEIRFHTLKFDLIAKLREDALIDRAATPQTGASIRIVVASPRWPCEAGHEREMPQI